jgi:hypothetical protein
MSRFIDRLNRLFKAEPQPMGFMVSRPSAESPKMQLVASLTADVVDKVSVALESADAALIEVTKADDVDALEKVCLAKQGVPGGGWLKSASSGTLEKALKAACDFWVFPATTPLSLTQKDKIGRILEVDFSLPEGLLRTANDLPIDAVLAFSKKEDIALTLNRLMLIQRLIYSIQKPVLVFVPDDLSSKELQALWDMGISGAVVQVTDETAGEKLAGLRKAIGELKAPAFRKKSRFGPMLPRMQPEAPQPPEEEEEDGDGEEDE